MTCPKTFLITGPSTVGPNYFNRFYAPLISKALAEHPDCQFVLGDREGVDRLAQLQLANANIAPTRVTIYTKRGITPELQCAAWGVVATANTWAERDLVMAGAATDTIAVLPQYGSGTSGAVLPLLSAGHLATTAADALNVLREHAEPYSASVAEFMRCFNEQFYAPPGKRDLNVCIAALRDVMTE